MITRANDITNTATVCLVGPDFSGQQEVMNVHPVSPGESFRSNRRSKDNQVLGKGSVKQGHDAGGSRRQTEQPFALGVGVNMGRIGCSDLRHDCSHHLVVRFTHTPARNRFESLDIEDITHIDSLLLPALLIPTVPTSLAGIKTS